MKPLILITNDDGVAAKGLMALTKVAREFSDVVVMAPERNASGLSHSITSWRPLRAKEIKREEGLSIHGCDGTPVDCVKLAVEHFCPRPPALVLSGINHGSNSSINILYSGTMGAVMEATALGFPAIGFSLLNHNPEADFGGCLPWVRKIIGTTLREGLPAHVVGTHPYPSQGGDGWREAKEGMSGGTVALNVNIPRLAADEIKGIRICRQAQARWSDSFEKRVDPQGRPYWWLTGKFDCPEPSEDSDEWALAHGYVAVVPIHTDFTDYPSIEKLTQTYE